MLVIALVFCDFDIEMLLCVYPATISEGRKI